MGEAGEVQGGGHVIGSHRFPTDHSRTFLQLLNKDRIPTGLRQRKGNLLFHKTERSGCRLQAQPDSGFKCDHEGSGSPQPSNGLASFLDSTWKFPASVPESHPRAHTRVRGGRNKI